MGVLLAWTVSTATSWVLLKLLDTLNLSFFLFKESVLIVPVQCRPFESVCPVLVRAILDKDALWGRLRPSTSVTIRGVMAVFETVAVIELLV